MAKYRNTILLQKPYTHQEIVDGANANSTRYSLQVDKVPVGATKNLSKINFKADDGKYFSTLPTLVSNSKNVSLVLQTKKKSRKKVVECTYVLKYRNIGDGIIPDVSFKYKTEKFNEIWGRTPIITNLRVSRNRVSNNGGKIKILVNGDKDAKYALAINESQLNVDGTIDHMSDVSLLKPGEYNNKVNFSGQIDFPVIEGVLDRSGTKTITYTLPKSIVAKTVNTHTGSGTKVLRVKSVKNVKIGDRIKSPSIPKGLPVFVEDINSAINEIHTTKRITFSSIDTSVFFERERVFTVNLVKENYSELPEKSSCAIEQFINPTLTINYNVGGSTTISHVNGVATSVGPGADQSSIIVGGFHTAKSKLTYYSDKNYNPFELDVDLTLVRGSNFTTFSNPPDIYPGEIIDGGFTMPLSHELNESMRVYVCGIRTSTLPNTTIHLYFKVKVITWGLKDQVLNLDVDSLFN